MFVLASLPCALVAAPVLRVCADPDNLPFSNQREQGFENRLAHILAADAGMHVEFIWWPQRKNFIEKSLGASACDAIMGVPSDIPDIAVTRPYYTSTYVWIEKRDRTPHISSLYDEHLKLLRIGAHIVDDSYVPPAQVLAQNGEAANLVGFSLNGASGLLEAVRRGDVDLGLAWGPLAGYFAGDSLAITPVTPQRFGMLPFVYSISVGVRKNDRSLRDKLDGAIARQCAAVQNLLTEYRVPLASERRTPCALASSASASLSSR